MQSNNTAPSLANNAKLPEASEIPLYSSEELGRGRIKDKAGGGWWEGE